MQTQRWCYTLAAIGIALLGIATLLSLPVAAQAPVPSASGPVSSSPDGKASLAQPASPNAVLYDQYDNPSANGSSSQNFEPALDAYDDFLADDFVVPYNQSWEISQVDVQGSYFNGTGPADSMSVFIYTEAITLPVTLVEARMDVTYTESSGNFSILLSSPILLSPGKYWLSVQANQNFTPDGQWAWTNRTITSNYPAAWQNPGGGFGFCPTWNLRTSCIGGDTSSPDQVFRLSGVSSTYFAPLTCGAGAPGPWLMRNYLPVPVYGVSVASDGTYAYAVGGYSFQVGKDITQTLRYDPAGNTWTGLTPVPDARSMASVVYAPINNKIYVFGGEKILTSQVFSTTLIYDIASHTWSTGALMPDVRAFMSAGYDNGKIYLVGGYSTGSVNPAYAQTWEYDVLANTWTAKADMPHALGGAASAVVNGHLYVLGGRDASNVVTDQTYDYDIVHNTWSSRLNMPYPVNVASAAVLDGKIWVIGGGTPFLAGEGPATLAANNMPEAFNTTQIYDPAVNDWSPGPNLNVQRSFLGAAGVGSFAVAIGGYNGSTTSDATEATMNCPAVHFSAADYSVSENAGTIQIPVTLEPISPLTATINFFTANGSATAGSDYNAITGTLIFPPGVTSKTFNVTILNDTVFEDNETVLLWLGPSIQATILPPNPATLHILNDDPAPALTCGFNTPGPWVLRNFLTPSAYGPAVTNDGTFAYVIGGFSFDAFTDTSQTARYNPIANTWTALSPAPKVVTMGSAVYAPINHKLYLFGGESVSSGLVYSSTLIYDITHNSWSNGAPMPGERAFMSAGYSNGKIYLVGGYTTTAITSAQAQTWEYNVLANTWTVKANMPHALGGAGAAVVNGHLFVIGGRDSGDVVTNQVYNYNIATNTWSSGTNAPYAVNVPGVAVLHNKIWVIGGGSPFLGLDGSLPTLDLNAPSTYNTTRIYDPLTNNWSNGPNLNVPRSFIGATGFGNFAVAFGGYSGSSTTGAIEITWACPNGYLPVVVNQGP